MHVITRTLKKWKEQWVPIDGRYIPSILVKIPIEDGGQFFKSLAKKTSVENLGALVVLKLKRPQANLNKFDISGSLRRPLF